MGLHTVYSCDAIGLIDLTDFETELHIGKVRVLILHHEEQRLVTNGIQVLLCIFREICAGYLLVEGHRRLLVHD